MLSRRNITAAIASLLIASVSSFSVLPTPTRRTSSLFSADSWDDTSSSGGGAGSIEQIEFKIYPDGRVEETVRGVKGNNCHKVTEAINEKLGEVVASSPTEEMYETEVTVNEQVSITDSNWEGSSSW